MSKEIKAGMTSAEKMRALRERAQAAVDRPGQPFTELADSVLLEACRIAFARGRTFALDEIFKALMTRANKRADPENRVLIHFPRELVTVTTADTNQPVTVTDSLTGKKRDPRGYPVEVKAKALRMRREGAMPAEIIAMIYDACGRAPDQKNLKTKALDPWSMDAEVLSLVEGGRNP